MSDDARELNLTERMIPMKGGKEYLQVADRIVWFRRDYPEGTIETSIISIDEERGSAIFRARVTTGKGGVAEATGDETLKDFPQGWIGKAETKAVGRALGYLGYGTASAGFEEGQRMVDAPQPPRAAPAFTRPRQDGPAASPQAAPNGGDYDAHLTWTDFWAWARPRGYKAKHDVAVALGKSDDAINGWTPAEMRTALEVHRDRPVAPPAGYAG